MLELTQREPVGRRYASQAYRNQCEGRTTFLTAWRDDEPLGSCEVTNGPHPALVNLNVTPAQRGQGVGTALIDAAERLATTSGELTISVADTNNAAARLYLRLGYAPTGRSTTTSYDFVDDDGVKRHAVEVAEALTKRL